MVFLDPSIWYYRIKSESLKLFHDPKIISNLQRSNPRWAFYSVLNKIYGILIRLSGYVFSFIISIMVLELLAEIFNHENSENESNSNLEHASTMMD